MAEGARLGIAKLNNSNYQVWKYKVELLLIKEGLWSTVEVTKPADVSDEWSIKDGKARATIGLLVEDNQLCHVRKHTTSHEMWISLQNYHQKSTLSNKVNLLKRLCSLKLDENRSDMEEHINNMTDLIDQLTALGENLAEPLTVALLLSSLPDSYSTLITALETRPEADLTQDLVKNKLMEESRRRTEQGHGSQQGQEKVLKVNSTSQKYTNKRSCFFCKKQGHDKADCRKYKAWLKRKETSQQEQHKVNKVSNGEYITISNEEHICFILGETETLAWYIDSGATSHMTSNFDFFTELDETIQDKVYLADGQVIVTSGKGEGWIFSEDDQNQVSKIKVQDVLYVPQLHGSLLSVKKLVDKDFKVDFSNEQCTIKLKGNTIAVANIKNSLYVLNTQKALSVTDCNSFCIHEWHKRLGHRDIKAIKKLENKHLAAGLKLKSCKHTDVCEICIKGKMTKTPFPKKSSTQTTEIFQLVHSDVCGPIHVATPSGNKYILTLIDDFSRYTQICLLKNKSEVSRNIIQYVKQVQTMFGKTPKFIRSDRGGEYMNAEVDNFFSEEGIQRQTSAPYTPQQNGTAERKNRYLIEMTRCLLLESGLDNKYWGEAIQTANFLQNRLPTKHHEVTPYELWHGEKPNLERIKTFGIKAYTLIPEGQRLKLDDKAQLMTFVGYQEGSKAYRLLDRKTNKITISKHVKFIEDFDSESRRETVPDNLIEEETSQFEFEGEKDSSTHFDFGEEAEERIEETDSLKEVLRRSNRATKGQAPERLIETIQIAKESESQEAEPRTYEAAIKSKDAEFWINAMKEEITSLKDSKTWELTNLPPNKEAIGSKWVFKRKVNENGQVDRFKARLVAQGFSQKYGEEYDEVFAPVVRQTTFRTLLAIAGKRKMEVNHYDIQTAYLNGDLHHDIYMKQPKGHEEPGKQHLVCKLQKNLYGLKQRATEWNKKLHDSFMKMSLKQSNTDPCLYSKHSNGAWIYILVYVDDVIAASEESSNLREFESQLMRQFKMKNLGHLNFYLGLQIDRDAEGLFYVHQANYINRKTKEFGLEDSKPSRIPLEPGYLKRNEVEDPLETNTVYRAAIGSLLYISTNTRPDISVSTSILASKVSRPTQSDWTEVKRVFRYLKTTVQKRLKLGSDLLSETSILEGYADANWAGSEGRRSQSGYLFQLYGGTICWSSKIQPSVSLSSAEAEYVALSESAQEAVWLNRLLSDFHEPVKLPIVIYEDNQSCIKMLTGGRFSQRTKHIDIKYHFVRDLVTNNFLSVMYCPTDLMKADILTKPLEAVKTAKFSQAIGLEV